MNRLDHNLDRVADVWRFDAGSSHFFGRNDAFALIAEIDQNAAVRHADYLAFDQLAGVIDGLFLFELLKDRAEINIAGAVRLIGHRLSGSRLGNRPGRFCGRSRSCFRRRFRYSPRRGRCRSGYCFRSRCRCCFRNDCRSWRRFSCCFRDRCLRRFRNALGILVPFQLLQEPVWKTFPQRLDRVFVLRPKFRRFSILQSRC